MLIADYGNSHPVDCSQFFQQRIFICPLARRGDNSPSAASDTVVGIEQNGITCLDGGHCFGKPLPTSDTAFKGCRTMTINRLRIFSNSVDESGAPKVFDGSFTSWQLCNQTQAVVQMAVAVPQC